MSGSAMYPFLVEFALQHFNAHFQHLSDSYQLELNARKDVVGELIHDDSFVQSYNDNLSSYQDPFARCLESVSWPKVSDFVNVKFVSKCLFELSSSKYFIFLLSKHLQEIQ